MTSGAPIPIANPFEFNGRACILVVDDSPAILALMKLLLAGDYDIQLADSGEQALGIVRSATPPDLILLDVMMPGMDGYQLCRILQQDHETRDIPIIFLTAKTDPEEEAQGFALGAVDYIAKPISYPIVMARVRNTVALARRTAALRALSGKLSRYLSPQVTSAILEGKRDATLQTKRKKLTIFFSDIENFTEIVESLDPEHLTCLLNGYLTEMSTIALSYGGTVDKFIGDAILIFFGDPQTRGVQADALQCVRMAVAMQRRVSVIQEEWRKQGVSHRLRQRIGINTGFCDVGNFGSQQRMDYTVIGSQVNLAARLEDACEPGGILLSHETYALVKDEIACEERRPFSAKGIMKEIRCFAVKGIDNAALGVAAALRSPGDCSDDRPANTRIELDEYIDCTPLANSAAEGDT